MLDSMASFSYNEPEEQQHETMHETMQPTSLAANVYAPPFQHTPQHEPKQNTNQETETDTAFHGRPLSRGTRPNWTIRWLCAGSKNQHLRRLLSMTPLFCSRSLIKDGRSFCGTGRTSRSSWRWQVLLWPSSPWPIARSPTTDGCRSSAASTFSCWAARSGRTSVDRSSLSGPGCSPSESEDDE